VAELERSFIVERVEAGILNAQANGKRIGRPPSTYLAQEDRRAIAEVCRQGQGSLRQLAARFSTSVGMVQRRIKASQEQAASVLILRTPSGIRTA
jgi:DNA invertase Pin-like site-specific DNA recombinase